MKLNRMNSSGIAHFVVPVLVMVAIAGIGTYLLKASHADTLTASDDATTAAATRHNEFLFAPSSPSIASGNSIFANKPNSTAPSVQKTHPAATQVDLRPKWSPDGTKFAFVRTTKVSCGNGCTDYPENKGQIIVANASGATIRSLPISGYDLLNSYSWVANGKIIASVSNSSDPTTAKFVFLRLQDGAQTNFANSPTATGYQPWEAPRVYAVTDTKVLFTLNTQFCTVNLTGAASQSCNGSTNYNTGDPQLSTDGTKIVFRKNSKELDTANVDGTNVKVVPTTGLPQTNVYENFTWIPNSRSIVVGLFSTPDNKRNWYGVNIATGAVSSPILHTNYNGYSPGDGYIPINWYITP